MAAIADKNSNSVRNEALTAMKPNTRFPVNPAGGQDQQSPPFVPGGIPAWQQLRDRGIAGQGSAAANRAATGGAGPRVLPQSSIPLNPVNRTPPIVDPSQIPGRGDPSRGGIMSMQPPPQPGMTYDTSGPGGPGGPGSAPGIASMGGLQMGSSGPPGMFDHPGQQLGVQGPGDAGNIDNAISSLRSQLGQAGANGSPSGQTPPWIPPGAGVNGDLTSVRIPPGLNMSGNTGGPLGAMPGPSTKFPPVPSGNGNTTPGWSPFGSNGPSAAGGGLPTGRHPINNGQTGSYLDLLKQRLQGRIGSGGGTNPVGLSGLGPKADGRAPGGGMQL